LPLLPPAPPLLKGAGEDLLILAQSVPQPPPGRFLKTFSYSGPSGAVRVRQDARDGQQIYVDREFVFTDLPASLKGSDWIQAANADKLYSAVDLMELAAGVDGVVFVAHDGRLPRPDWLQRQFKTSELRVAVNGQSMNVYERRVHKGESLTLGSNAEDRRLKSSNMYIVFMTQAEAGERASR
jgi:beta-galactosidase